MNDFILKKLQHYCAYQERCHEEVRTKLLSLKIYGDGLEEVMNKLIEDDFLNEERFAKAYAGGKFRIKKWGRIKIVNELKKRKVTEYCIKQALLEIDEDDYLKELRKLIAAALKRYRSTNPLETKIKTTRYLISRGYEYPIVQQELK
ncbi:MAG: regulatory protein RecX [Chitinophagales bacterium]